MNLRSRHIPEIIGLRGLAISLILIFTCTWYVLNLGLIQVSESNLTFWFQKLLLSGWIALDLFMVLSGFLITREVLEFPQLNRFYWRRSLRIIPAYYLVLLLWFLLKNWYPFEMLGSSDVFLNGAFWAFYANVTQALFGSEIPMPLQHLWTIAVVVQFYLVWPGLLKLLRPVRMLWFCVGLIMICPLLRGLLVSQQGSIYSDSAFLLTPLRLDTFAWGALFALKPNWLENKKWIRAVCLGAVAIFAGLFYWDWGFNFKDSLVLTIGLSVVGCLFSTLLALALQGGILSWLLSFPFVQTLGKYSYGIYLFHQPVFLFFLLQAYLPGPGWSPFIVFFLLSSSVSLLLAMISFHFLELRLLRLAESDAVTSP